MNWFVFGGSLAAIVLLAGTIWAFRLGGLMGLDAQSAKHEAEAAIAGFEAIDAVVSADGTAALVAGRIGFALVRAHGAHHVVRPLLAPQIHVEGDRLIVQNDEAIFGKTTLELGAAEAQDWARRLGVESVLPNPVTYATPVFIALVLAEIVWAKLRKPDYYNPRDAFASLSLGLGSTVAGALVATAVAAAGVWVGRYRLLDIPYAWWSWPLCFVVDDFLYYVFHRSAHRVRWFWASHVIHHSSQHYNLSTALRQTWTGFISLAFLFRLPLFLIGFPAPMVFLCGGLNLIYQFWIHTEVIGRCPRWIEAVMNTPSHHRVHHATNPRYLDRNYAGVFIVWDRMFGSFTPERDDERIRYGIVKNLGSFNPLWAAVHEWAGIARDLLSAPWRHKLAYLIKPPGWSHDGSRDTSETIRAKWLARQVGTRERADVGQ